MNRFTKTLLATCVATLALGGILAVGASAAEFTYGATAALEGAQTSNQEFALTSSFGPVICRKAKTTGTVVSTAATSQKVTVVYSECTVNILGSREVKPITAEYNLLATGSVEILNNIKIEVPVLSCTTTVAKAQTVGPVTYDNMPIATPTEIEETDAVTGIHSTSTGLCPSGTTGTYTGSTLIHLAGGAEMSWDA